MNINKALIGRLLEQAAENPRLRQNFDLRTSPEDGSQRMLNAMLPGTKVDIHRHPRSNENVILLCGKMIALQYDDEGNEISRHIVDPSVGDYGLVVPAGVWHSVEILEPAVMYDAKDGKYGEDGSENFSNR